MAKYKNASKAIQYYGITNVKNEYEFFFSSGFFS